MASDSVSVVAAFGGGMLSFLSPCVLPLVPGYLSLMSGVSVTELQGGPGTERRGGVAVAVQPKVLRSTLLFVAGFTVVFVALGLTASALGALLNDHRRVLNQGAGLMVIFMGLFLAGFVTPRSLMAEHRFHVSPSKLGVWAPPVMGVAFAFGWTPCIGSILGPVLTMAGDQSTVARGGLLLAVYSLGLGVPFVLSGVALGRLTGIFNFVKRHFRAINVVGGLLLVVFGFFLFTNNLGWLSGKFSDLLKVVHLQRFSTS